jgi:hypothetical protein
MSDQELTVDIPVRMRSPNALDSEHHYARVQRRRKEHEAVAKALSPYQPPTLDDGQNMTITLTRMAPGKLDTDNLAFSAKAVRDAIAAWLHIDDGDERLDWRYDQQKVRTKGIIDQGKRKGIKVGFLQWVRCHMRLSKGVIEKAAPGATSTEQPPLPSDEELERIALDGEAIYGEPKVRWSTGPGVELVNIPRLAGRKGNTRTELSVSARVAPIDHPRKGAPYVLFCVWFPNNGRTYRSRGAAILRTEVPAVIAALTAYMEQEPKVPARQAAATAAATAGSSSHSRQQQPQRRSPRSLSRRYYR